MGFKSQVARGDAKDMACRKRSRGPRLAAVLLGTLCLSLACRGKPQRFSTRVEVVQVRTFGSTNKLTDLEVKYADCPADARQFMRLDKEFTACGQPLKAGDKLPADVLLTWNPDRGFYRNEIVRLGKCEVKLDPKDEANYQSVEACSEVKASGIVVGVRCERGRSPALLEKCPWLRRE
jgi:hypothetical protein